jgi:CubicO group peptidase (beta-lactamase class C family)
MKLVIFSLCLAFTVTVAAQTSRQKKTDSVCYLITRFLSEKAYDSLYQLTGRVFRSRVSVSTFRRVAEAEFAPLGKIEKTILKGTAEGTSWYKISFPSQTLTLIISLDGQHKLAFFRLRKGKDNDRVASSNPMRTDIDKIVEGVARAYMAQENTVGLSIGIIVDGKEYYYGYGETAIGNGKLPAASTMFEIASVTKTFTATLLAMAVEEGRVRLDDPVNKYLPDSIPLIQFNNKPVTFRSLANHTAGFPFMPANFDSSVVDPVRFPNRHYTVGKLYSSLKYLQLNAEPGTKYRYSNAGFGLTGTLLQKIYNQTYEQLLLRKICQPLHMQNTRAYIMNAKPAIIATGYDSHGKRITPWDHQPALIGHGGLASSARDMIKYAAAQLGQCKGMLQKAIQLTHDTTFSNDQVAIGMAWQFIKPGFTTVLYHGGGTAGYGSYFAVNREKKLAVVLLSNTPGAPVHDGDVLMARLEEYVGEK